MRVVHFLASLCLVCFIGPLAWAQAVPSREPSGTHIFPAGGRRGTMVPVRVGAECLPPGAYFHLYGVGATASATLGPRAQARYEPSPRRNPNDADGGERIAYSQEWQTEIAIAGDAPLGPILWRATCGFGGTQPRPFVIGDGPEWIESEPNSTPDRAERLALPLTVNGQIAGERDVDCYLIQAQAGDVVTCDVLAARLGSPLEAVVEVRDARGRRLPAHELRIGGDPVLAFRAAAEGALTLSIANLGYRGGPEFVYRLNLTTAPYAVLAFPPGGRAGESRELEFFALTGHAPRGATHDGKRSVPTPWSSRAEFRSWKEVVAFPTTVPPHARFAAHRVPLEVSDIPELVAAQDRAASASPQAIAAPIAINGRLPAAASDDVFLMPAKKDAAFSISCSACPAASEASPLVTVEDAAGRPLAKTTAAEAAERRCRLDWKAPADGDYRVRVRDLRPSVRGGTEYSYRLLVRPAVPDFAMTLTADYANVVQNGRTELNGVVERFGRFVGPVTLNVSGLPEGVRSEPSSLAPNQTAFKLVLAASDDARPTSAKVRLTGEAVIGGQTLRRAAACAPIGGRDGVCALLPNNALYVTIQHRPIFRLNCNEAYQYAHRGTVHHYPLEVERLHGFAGPIVLRICDRQVQDLDGIEVFEQTIAPAAKEAAALIYLPETMHANVQHHCRPYVQGHATFVDRWGQPQTMLAVCEKRCMIRTMPPVVKLKALDETLSLPPGGEVVCRLALERTSNFHEAMEIELVQPPAGLTAAMTRLEAGATRAEVKLLVGASYRGESHRGGAASVRFRATGRRSNQVVVISEAEVRLGAP